MIVIPMAGLSSRFFKAGYDKPKYMLEAHGKTLFEHSVSSFQAYFKTERFLFIVRDVFHTPEFVRQKATSLGIYDFDVVILSAETRGQAETVSMGLESCKAYEGSLTIFNIDTFRPSFTYPKESLMGDGYLDVFIGEGANWSFAEPKGDSSNRVLKTAEKKPISNLCCTGLYYFKHINDYLNSYTDYLEKPVVEWENGELFVAPLYNHLIQSGLDIRFNTISRHDVIFCGVPSEYTEFLDIKPKNM